MKMKNYLTTFVLTLCIALAAFLLLINGCEQSNNVTNTQNSPQTGNITGTVYTAGNYTLYGVTVSVGNNTCYTDSKGRFFLNNVPIGSRVLVNFNLDGYTFTQKIVAVKSNHTVSVDASLIRIGGWRNLNAITGGSIQVNGANVEIPPNALLDSKGNPFKGTALIKATYFDPSSDAFYGCFPGEFKGIDASNVETMIESFGFISVEIFNGSEKLQLATGKEANITIPISSKLQGKAPASIPLWYYDEVKGKWYEEGTATRSGNSYLGTVKHFSNWNCDMPALTSYLTGKVIDSSGNPISFARVVSEGIDYSGQSTATTSDDGTFTLRVKANSNAKVYAKYYTFSSSPSGISTPSVAETLDIGTIIIPIDTMNVVTIVGRIVDNAGMPFRGVYVMLWDSTYTNSENSHSPEDYCNINDDGKFKLFGTMNKSYYIKFSYKQDSTCSTETVKLFFTTGNKNETKDLGNIKIDVGGSMVIGTVVDSSGNPLANILCLTGTKCDSSVEYTNTSGKFSIRSRPNISFLLQLYGDSTNKHKDLHISSGKLGSTTDLGNIIFP
jgi:protocatechuate 3,4-dioxygenase beta subunit